jgi:hypothetical protein
MNGMVRFICYYLFVLVLAISPGNDVFACHLFQETVAFFLIRKGLRVACFSNCCRSCRSPLLLIDPTRHYGEPGCRLANYSPNHMVPAQHGGLLITQLWMRVIFSLKHTTTNVCMPDSSGAGFLCAILQYDENKSKKEYGKIPCSSWHMRQWEWCLCCALAK